MRRSWPALAPTEGSTSGIFRRLEKSRAPRTLRTDRQNFSSSTEVTLPRSLTSAGTLTTPGSSAVCPKTISCRSGKWPRISTMTRNQKLQPQNSRTANKEIFYFVNDKISVFAATGSISVFILYFTPRRGTSNKHYGEPHRHCVAYLLISCLCSCTHSRGRGHHE